MSSPFVVLLGAGASVPAGKPTIEQLTKGFLEEINRSNDQELIEAYSFVQKVFQDREGKFDVELALQALTELTEQPTSTIQFFHGGLLEEAQKHGSSFPKIKNDLKSYIRRECQDPGDFSYLKPLPLGFMDDKAGLDIFTLNYDPTIEALCDSEHISLTDGFDPAWNPSSFDNGSNSIRLYKIHGSVYWFLRSPGRFVKVPVKGSLKGIQYYTGEELSEIVLYPAFEKKTDSGPYPFILNRFREKLGSTRLLIAVGYSFRDRNIRTLIIEQMRSNPSLWLLLASPNAKVRREELCREAPELAIRIVSLSQDVETSITRRRLRESVQVLANARVGEEGAREDQARYSNIQEVQWVQCLREYKDLQHYPKLKEIGRETLLSSSITKSPNFMMEQFLSHLTLRFGLEDLVEENILDSAKWLQYFTELCPAADDNLFYRYQNVALNDHVRAELRKELDIIEPGKREQWVNRSGIDMGQFVNEVVGVTKWFSTSGHGLRFDTVMTYLEALSETVSLLNPQPQPGENQMQTTGRMMNTLTETLKKNGGGFYLLAGKILQSVKQIDLKQNVPGNIVDSQAT